MNLQRFYLIGSDKNKRFFRVLKIDRSEPSELNISEDPVVYSQQEVKSLLQRIAAVSYTHLTLPTKRIV